VRLLLDHSFITAPVTHPFVAGWEAAPADLEVTANPGLSGRDIGPDDLGFIPLAEFAFLQETHQIVPDVAVVAGNSGMVAMRCPVRPDGIGITPVRLIDTDGAGEILARATLRAFYGIHASAWTRSEEEPAEVVIVSGPLAVAPAEAGFSEDLCRAWVILTGSRAVDHVLVAPRTLDRQSIGPALDFLKRLVATGRERRRDIRREISEPFGLDRDRLAEVQNAYTFELDVDDQQSARLLLQRGIPGSAYPSVRDVAFMARS
jgi:hypothetical protein